MKKISAVCLAVILALLSLPSAAESFSDNPDLIETAALSVLKLTTYDVFGKPVATGSGFVMFDNITLITNYHVMEDAFSMTAESDEGYQYYITGIKIADQKKDIAIMQFSAPTTMKPLEHSDDSLKRGGRVTAISSPVGLKNSVSMGNISAVFTEDDTQWIQTTAPISPGSSGGALLNEAGKVIGITSASRSDGQNINFAINIAEAVALYNSWDHSVTRLGHQPGYAEKLSDMGDQYYYGKNNIKEDYHTAFLYYTEAAKLENLHAVYMLGRCSYFGNGTEKNYKKAAEYFSLAAEGGDPEAINMLGECYVYGDGVEKNFEKAESLFLKAAELQNTDAMINIGCFYAGLISDVPEDKNTFHKAFSWFQKAAMKNDAYGMAYLSHCYEIGIGVEIDHIKMKEWLVKGADLGNNLCLTVLGDDYYYGIYEGFEINKKKAAEYYAKAAEAGYAYGKYMLAVCYYIGEGVNKNMQKAFDLASEAADLGNAGAMGLLGLIYERGDMNYEMAEQWYLKAIDAGNKNAQERLNNLRNGYHN